MFCYWEEPYGTGSYPDPPHGLHLSMRQMDSAIPLKKPCLRRAWRAYSEQVGWKRHDAGVYGVINF